MRSLRLFWIAALFGVAILLGTVGFLQYRWNTQIRRAEEVRVGTDLESLIIKWHLDFYGEFSTACVALQIGPDSGERDSWEDYLHRYARWTRVAGSNDSIESIYTNRDVVRDVYIWETSRKAQPRLLRLNADEEKTERFAVPPYLEALLAHLQRNSSSLPVALHAWELNGSPNESYRGIDERATPSHLLRSNAETGWQFDEKLPALVHPIFHYTHHGAVDTKALSNLDPVDWVVVVLNFETIQKRILPELMRRYFGGSKGLEYKLAVIAAGETPRLLYSSDPEFGAREVSASDSVMNIFGPPPEITDGHSWQTGRSTGLKQEDWHSFSSPVWFPVIQYTAQDGPWMLVLQHRTGPLDAAVTRVWRSNLLTGGVVLLLLATSMVLVVVASQRVRALANLQMDFVASVSHELRTPLATLLSAGQNMTDGFVADLPRYGSIVTTQARQLIELVDQILLFASMKGGQKQYVVRPLQLIDLFGELRKNVLPMFEQGGFCIDCQLPDAMSHSRVLGDLQALSRCLQNLIGNAVKYSGESRWVGVLAELEKPNNSGPQVKISVKDNGMGISSSELRHIFEPFYRSPRVLAAQIRGTGLGLSVARQIAEAMGGRVSVFSEVGVGSVFILHLRVAKESDPRTIVNIEDVVTSK